MAIKNRITDMLGVEYPIVQAPMGWIARAQLASRRLQRRRPRHHRNIVRPTR